MISQHGGGGMGDNWFDQQWHPTGGWRYDWNEWEYSNIFTGETRFHSEATPSFFGSIIGPSGVEKHYRKEWVCHVYNPYTYEDGSQAYVPWYSTYIWSLEFVDYNKIPTSFGIGQPGSWESLIPIWASGRAAIDHFQNGDYWRGLGHTALAVSDVFLVKSIGTALGKGAWKLGGHSWSATRSWLGKRGYAQAGQPVHHWALTQSTARKYGLESISNQPWNLMPMQSQAMHTAVHGWGRNAYGPIGQFWYGTPTWFKASIFSGGGRLFD